MSKLGKTVLFATLGLAACAVPSPPQRAAQQDDMLVRAGFVTRTANTDSRIAGLRALPAHKFIVRTVGGQPAYLFADPLVCKCVYFGRQANWDRYQKERYDRNLSGIRAETSGLYEMIQYNYDDWGNF